MKFYTGIEPGINHAHNTILLRSDFHKLFDDLRFVFIPKYFNGATKPKLVVHCTEPSPVVEQKYHNRELLSVGSSIEMLFTRFAIAVFSNIEYFFSSDQNRRLLLRIKNPYFVQGTDQFYTPSQCEKIRPKPSKSAVAESTTSKNERKRKQPEEDSSTTPAKNEPVYKSPSKIKSLTAIWLEREHARSLADYSPAEGESGVWVKNSQTLVGSNDSIDFPPVQDLNWIVQEPSDIIWAYIMFAAGAPWGYLRLRFVWFGRPSAYLNRLLSSWKPLLRSRAPFELDQEAWKTRRKQHMGQEHQWRLPTD